MVAEKPPTCREGSERVSKFEFNYRMERLFIDNRNFGILTLVSASGATFL